MALLDYQNISEAHLDSRMGYNSNVRHSAITYTGGRMHISVSTVGMDYREYDVPSIIGVVDVEIQMTMSQPTQF